MSWTGFSIFHFLWYRVGKTAGSGLKKGFSFYFSHEQAVVNSATSNAPGVGRYYLKKDLQYGFSFSFPPDEIFPRRCEMKA